MTVTFDLPETLAVQLLSMPEHERNRFAVARLTADVESDQQDDLLLSVDDLAALRKSRADLDAGRVQPFAQMLAGIRQESGNAS